MLLFLSSGYIFEFHPLPVRGGTPRGAMRLLFSEISIHPPRAGRDSRQKVTTFSGKDFNPPSRAGRDETRLRTCKLNHLNFNPPSPCGEGHFFNGLMSEMD